MTLGPGPDVICLGESMAMFVPIDGRPFNLSHRFYRTVGGAESNVACYLASTDIPVGWASRLGNDGNGQFVLNRLRHHGIDLSQVEIDNERPTGLYFKTIDASRPGVEYYRHGSAASYMATNMADALMSRKPKLIHSTGVTAAISDSCRAMLQHLFSLERGSTTISFDINLRPALVRRQPPKLMRELASAADIVFVSRDEAEKVWNTHDPAVIHSQLQRTAILAVKDSDSGVTVSSAGQLTFTPSLNVQATEVTGAGDGFAAGFLCGILRNESISTSSRLGHILAASAMTTVDDVGNTPGLQHMYKIAELPDDQWKAISVANGEYVMSFTTSNHSTAALPSITKPTAMTAGPEASVAGGPEESNKEETRT